MRSSKTFVVLLIILVLMGLAFIFLSLREGYFSVDQVNQKEQKIIEKQKEPFFVTKNTVKEIKGEEYKPATAEEGEAKSISGYVKKIEEGKIILLIPSLDSGDSSISEEKVIEFENDVKVYRRILKDKEVFRREVVEFETKANDPSRENESESNAKDVSIPLSFIQKEGNLSDIKENSFISVVSASSVEEVGNIQAIEIDILN